MNPAQHLDFRIGCATTVYTSVVIGSAFLIVCSAFLQQTLTAPLAAAYKYSNIGPAPADRPLWQRLLSLTAPASVWQLLILVFCVWFTVLMGLC